MYAIIQDHKVLKYIGTAEKAFRVYQELTESECTGTLYVAHILELNDGPKTCKD